MTPTDHGDDPNHGDVVSDIVRAANARLAELQVYLDEAEKLRAVIAATEGLSAAAGSSRADGRRGQGSNKRAILAIIAENPGITAAEIARINGMKRTVVASTVSRLKRIGELEADGRGVRLPDASAN